MSSSCMVADWCFVMCTRVMYDGALGSQFQTSCPVACQNIIAITETIKLDASSHSKAGGMLFNGVLG